MLKTALNMNLVYIFTAIPEQAKMKNQEYLIFPSFHICSLLPLIHTIFRVKSMHLTSRL